ncbi:MAG: thiamine pyrophosphate-dependent enzyme [Gammaproteobacteria bacterium]|nr:thiamine pyrophosphate-dependent enzyme [Gammaproteobacteria bacterium]
MSESKQLQMSAPWLEISATESDWDEAGPAELLKMLNHMHLIRAFEEEILNLDREGLAHGPMHVSVGQEGAVVAAMSLLNSSDAINGPHRGHHLFLAKALNHIDPKGYDPRREQTPAAVGEVLYRTMAEILGLSPGYCKGRGGSMHLRWKEAGVIGTNAIVGGGVPLANGAAWSRKRLGQNEVVFTFFGDGACHIGNVLESLNLAALYDLPICFFIENNQYAVSTTLDEEARETRMSSRGPGFGIPSYRVDGLNPMSVRVATAEVLALLRSGRGPAVLEANVYRYYHHGGGLPGSAFGYRSKEEEAAARDRDPLALVASQMIARGWMSEADVADIGSAARQAVTVASGRLTEIAEGKRRIVPSLWPDPSFRDQGLRGDLSEFNGVSFVEQDTYKGPLKDVKMIESIAAVMTRRMETDERYFVMGEDVHKLRGGTNGATRGIPQRWPDRCIPTPIAEHGFVGLCGGVAIDGHFRPVVELMYPDFSLVAADQLFNQIAKARHMFGGDTPVPLVLRTKVALGSGYGSQHSMDPAGLFAMWPGWRIVAPSTPFDYVGLMNSALKCEDPVMMLEHVGLYQSVGPGTDTDFDYFIPLGKARVVRRGGAFTVLTYLTMVGQAVQIANDMGVDAEVIDLRSLDRAGIDWKTIGDSVRKTHNVVVLEQGPLTTSYGAMVTDELQRRFFDYLDQPVKRIHGGEASPSVSKVLERSAMVGEEEIRSGFARMVADMGRSFAAVG